MRTSFSKKMRPRCPPHPGQAGRWLGNAPIEQGVPANQGALANSFRQIRETDTLWTHIARSEQCTLAIKPLEVRPRSL
jgi:hypothetical protein